jgi:hypothetical protein
MKKVFLMIIMLSAVVSLAAQTNNTLPNFSDATVVNDALLKAQAAISGSGTINQLAYFIGPTTVSSLSIVTYPSLTELTYLKGVTSKVQTQLDSKQSVLVSGTNIKTFNGQSILGNGNIIVASDTSGLWSRVYNEVKSQMNGYTINGTGSTLDSIITDFRKNNSLRLNK